MEVDGEVAVKDDKEEVTRDDEKIVVKDDREVVIDDTIYSLVKLPGKETRLVVAERARLLGHIDLRTLVRDLGRIGRCFRVAYNGVVAAGPEFTELQIAIQTLGNDVTTLWEKSTVSSFKRESPQVLTALRATYEYLLDGNEDIMSTLASAARIARQIAEESKKLRVNFKEAADKAEAAVRNIQVLRAEKELEKKQKVQKEVVAEDVKWKHFRRREMEKPTEFAILTDRCKTEEDFTNASAKVLHKAMVGLRYLSGLMMQAALFWNQMQTYSQQLSEDGLNKIVSKAKERYKPDTWRRLWTSRVFKIRTVKFNASWVALDSVYGEYMKVIEKIQEELYRYIKENPSYEDAKVAVHQLALTLKKEIEDDHKALEDKTSSE